MSNLKGGGRSPLKSQKITYFYAWGVSAVGSARHWQCRGHEFESRTLHFLIGFLCKNCSHNFIVPAVSINLLLALLLLLFRLCMSKKSQLYYNYRLWQFCNHLFYLIRKLLNCMVYSVHY